MHAPLSPDLYPLSRTWKATPRICSVFLLSPPSLSILASVVTDEERWSHLWRGSVQHCIAPRPHPTTQHKSDHTTRTFRRALMNRFLYLSQLCCNAGLEQIGTAHYSSSSFALFCQALVSSDLGAEMLNNAHWLSLNEDIICRVALKAVKCIKVTMSYYLECADEE